MEAAANDDTSATTDAALPSRVHFPESLHVQDESVNRIVLQAMEACADGDYDAFRLLWTAREEPLARDEFNHGWETVQRIQVLALEEIKLGHDEAGEDVRTAYAIFADVQLDPETRAGMRNPQRQAVSIIVKDNGEWKLAKAPKAVRKWLRERVAETTKSAAAPDPAANDRP